jgi:CP family cyanate transporter-like MFS transporter
LQAPRTILAVALLWLAGNALRLTILAIPPVIQMIKDDLGLTATEVGVLAGIPIILFAAAALLGSLLIARFGPVGTLLGGLVISGIGSGLRGAATTALGLDAATILVGFGVAVMQPAMPALVRLWLPEHIGFGTAVYTNGLLVGEILPVSLTIPVILPMAGGSWRIALVIWGLAVLPIAGCIAFLAPRLSTASAAESAVRTRQWPNWSDGLIWRLGLLFASANSIYFACNAFLPIYLSSTGRESAVGPALTALNLGQLPASFILLAFADRVAGRSWPYAIAGLIAILGVASVVVVPGSGAVAAAAFVGFACAGTLVLTLALPPLLCGPEEVASTSAAMFTLSYGSAVVTSVVSGALWDLTKVPAAAFLPMGLWAIALLGSAPIAKFQRAR